MTIAIPPIDGDVELIYEHGEPHGIRDRSGFLCFFNKVPHFRGQSARYERELAARRDMAKFIADSLQVAAKCRKAGSSHMTWLPVEATE